jgi:hypothetical protein
MQEQILTQSAISWLSPLRQERALKGWCIRCSKPRGDDGTKWHCRPCADYITQHSQRFRERRRKAGLCSQCGLLNSGENKGNKFICATCVESNRGNHRKYRYGVTREQFAEIVASQGGLCAICHRKPSKGELVMDHCHVTNKPREALCVACNSGIGLFRDNTNDLNSAIKYLEKWADAHASE